jgi:hypothetical protein
MSTLKNPTFIFDWTQIQVVIFHIQWNLYYPTPQDTKEMCRIVEDVGILSFHFR